MLYALTGLSCRLQAESSLSQQVAHRALTDSMSFSIELFGQSVGTLAGPPERRHRVTACNWIHQGVKRLHQSGILVDQLLSSAASRSDSLPLATRLPRRHSGSLQFGKTGINRRARQACRLGDQTDTTTPKATGFRCRPGAQGSLVQP